MGGSSTAVYTLINSYLADRLPDLYVQIDDEITNFPFVSVGEVQSIKQDSKYFEHYEITQTIRLYHNDLNERTTLENIIHKLISELENVTYKVNGWQLDLLDYNYDISVEIDTSTQKYLRLFCELTFKGIQTNDLQNVVQKTPSELLKEYDEQRKLLIKNSLKDYASEDFEKQIIDNKNANTSITFEKDHVVYLYAKLTTSREVTALITFFVYDKSGGSNVGILDFTDLTPKKEAHDSIIFTTWTDNITLQLMDLTFDNTLSYELDLKIYDLTEIFGQGNEPKLEEFERLLA